MTTDIQTTSEPVEVEWKDGLDNIQTVTVNPYNGTVTINGREYPIGTLCSEDVPDWMYQSHPSIEGP